MRVTCPTCGKVYDDFNRWTICPHRTLDEMAQTPAEREAAGRGAPAEERTVAGGEHVEAPASTVAEGVSPLVEGAGEPSGYQSGNVGGVIGGTPYDGQTERELQTYVDGSTRVETVAASTESPTADQRAALIVDGLQVIETPRPGVLIAPEKLKLRIAAAIREAEDDCVERLTPAAPTEPAGA